MSGFYQPDLIPGLEEALRIVRHMNHVGCTSLDIEIDLKNVVERRRRNRAEIQTHARQSGNPADAIAGRCLDITGEITLDRGGVTVGTFLSDADRAFAVQAWNAARDAKIAQPTKAAL